MLELPGQWLGHGRYSESRREQGSPVGLLVAPTILESKVSLWGQGGASEAADQDGANTLNPHKAGSQGESQELQLILTHMVQHCGIWCVWNTRCW